MRKRPACLGSYITNYVLTEDPRGPGQFAAELEGQFWWQSGVHTQIVWCGISEVDPRTLGFQGIPGCHRPYPKMDQPKLDFHDAPPMAPKLDKILRRLIWLGAPKVPKSILLWSQCWLQSPMFRQRSAGNKSLQVIIFLLLTPFFWKNVSTITLLSDAHHDMYTF